MRSLASRAPLACGAPLPDQATSGGDSEMRFSSLLLPAVMTAVSVTAQAQRPPALPQLDSGAVVRVRLNNGNREVIRLIAPIGPDSTLLRYCGNLDASCPARLDRRRQVEIGRVVGLDVRNGTHARAGALVGGVLGLGLVYAIAGQMRDSPTGWRAAGIMVGGVAASAGWGALVGSWIDSWRPAVPRTP